ncbi:hypothetical protein SAMN05444380_105100 [Thermophagus xiamenensis]|uniref:Uncharacterized protein n=1 Tax=Thermophagus xiamenensis TaxID=385682 RepID=A0A1I1X315_9BACT|nr:hypothetical protein SAMN05444380_105100 [Thermophagus xiamenensis]
MSKHTLFLYLLYPNLFYYQLLSYLCSIKSKVFFVFEIDRVFTCELISVVVPDS